MQDWFNLIGAGYQLPAGVLQDLRDFVNRGSEFDDLYIYQPVLEACRRIIGRPFRLSTMHARTVRSRSQAQALHVDFEHDREGWTMIGFIFMVDEFRRDNGATRFIPESHNWSIGPDELKHNPRTDDENHILACESISPVKTNKKLRQ
jgi:ectoine hydroxylase-related dioxygenase (phytanoyl-CoA dioxygenase family)